MKHTYGRIKLALASAALLVTPSLGLCERQFRIRPILLVSHSG